MALLSTQPLHAATVTIPDPGGLEPFLTPRAAAMIRRREGFVGLGEVARFEADSVCQADQWWGEFSARIENETEIPGRFGTGPVCMGSFSFDPDRGGVLIVPRTVIGRRAGSAWLTTITRGRGEPELPDVQPAPLPPKDLQTREGEFGSEDYMAVVEQLIRRLRAGQARKVVLCRDLIARACEPVDTTFVLRALLSEEPDAWGFCLPGLTGASTELLIRREAGLTRARVVAGTMVRLEGVPEASLVARLATSEQDLSEHRAALAEVRERLAPHLRVMHIPEAPFCHPQSNAWQLVTDITGIADPGLSTLALVDQLMPSTGACGVPAAAALELIRRYEPLDRGRCTGPVGWMDAQGDGEWVSANRTVESSDDGRTLRLCAASSVLPGSNPHRSLVETEIRLDVTRAALCAQP